MLSRQAEAVTLDLDGSSAPDDSRSRRNGRCQAGTTDHQQRFWQEVDVSMLFRHTLQGYSHPRSVSADGRSGECRLNQGG
jgi:hypothetical protein